MKCAGNEVKMKEILFWALIPFAVSASAAAPDNGPKPGNYEVNAVWILQGQSRPGAPAQSCLNQKDLNNPERVFNVSTVRDARNCTITNLVYANGKISYDVDCGQLFIHVKGTYTETGYSVIRTLGIKGKPTDTSSQIQLNAKRTGDCTVRVLPKL
jgi:Protein of unknown function (DUF3617)